MKYTLFTTTTCPKCPAVKELLNSQNSITGETLDETNPNFHSLAQKYNVMNVPTVIVFDTNGEKIFQNSEEYEIAKFIQEHQ